MHHFTAGITETVVTAIDEQRGMRWLQQPFWLSRVTEGKCSEEWLFHLLTNCKAGSLRWVDVVCVAIAVPRSGRKCVHLCTHLHVYA